MGPYRNTYAAVGTGWGFREIGKSEIAGNLPTKRYWGN